MLKPTWSQGCTPLNTTAYSTAFKGVAFRNSTPTVTLVCFKADCGPLKPSLACTACCCVGECSLLGDELALGWAGMVDHSPSNSQSTRSVTQQPMCCTDPDYPDVVHRIIPATHDLHASMFVSSGIALLGAVTQVQSTSSAPSGTPAFSHNTCGTPRT